MLDLNLDQESKKYLGRMDLACLCKVWWIVAFDPAPEPLGFFLLGLGWLFFCGFFRECTENELEKSGWNTCTWMKKGKEIKSDKTPLN